MEISVDTAGVLLRDSKDPAGPVLGFSRTAWRTFVVAVAAEEFDRDR
jgi:hypothetical protein